MGEQSLNSVPVGALAAGPALDADFGELPLESGSRLPQFRLRYRVWGKLNEARANAILITHAFTGDSHAAGLDPVSGRAGWWDSMIGPGKAFDTERFFVICANVIGGCAGSTGPGSLMPGSEEIYGTRFPLVTIGDMVNAERMLIDRLGIEKLFAVAGGSMGGMQALEWQLRFPERVRSALIVSTAARHTPQQIAFNEVGRRAIMADPAWNGGFYSAENPPVAGLGVARMVGHITYMSEHSMGEKFGRRRISEIRDAPFAPGFTVEDYLDRRGAGFTRRFDANSYLYITKAMDLYDPAGERPLAEILRGNPVRTLVLAFESDWLYPPTQTREIARACKLAGVDASFALIPARWGHDSFLVETEQQSRLIRHFLESQQQLGKNA